ncbi:MAG: lipopolysaccharide biosynthesis protein, partial [Sphingobacteriia bacterium]
MGTIRKQTIISSVVVYFGFFIGAINQYFYLKNGLFTLEQYGVTRIFFDFAQNMFAFGALGIIPVIYKFYPYYKDNLEAHKIDLMTWGMVSAFIGFVLVIILGWYFQPVFVHQFSEKSKLIVDYYYWMFPFAMGMLFFSVMEGFAWALQKSVLSNFLKETGLRILTSVIILLYYFKLIKFEDFVHLFAFLYLVIFLVLAAYLYKSKLLHFPTTVSRVSKKFWKKMMGMQLLIYSGTIIASVAATIDSFIIAKFQGLGVVAVFGMAQYAANLIQVPQRSIQAVSSSVL